MTTTQPEALALADELEKIIHPFDRHPVSQAAAMLRAQHAEIEALKAAHDDLTTVYMVGYSKGVDAAIAAQRGEKG